MRSYEEFAIQIEELLQNNRVVFIKTEPDIPDFTSTSPFKISVWTKDAQATTEVSGRDIQSLIGIFDHTIFQKSRVDQLYAWNIKSLASYFFFHIKKTLNIEPILIDLKIIENFLNIRKNVPQNFKEVIDRIKLVVKTTDWQFLYKTIHLPLALRVLPAIESTSLLNEATKKPEHPYYEIEGQFSGRMNCVKAFTNSYLAHNMGQDVKQNLIPKGYDFRFLCSDFKHCEVTVLQKLSDDQKLKSIIDSGEDLHNIIYEIITGDKCNNENKRNISKKIFLPVMFGLGNLGLAKNIGISDALAAELINRIKNNFATSWDYMIYVQEQAKKGLVKDYFGRPRLFSPDKCYLARNLAIQGVAATVCQEKLIDLHNSLKEEVARICFSVHDGYGFLTTIGKAREAYEEVKKICESESKLISGLSMKVVVKLGGKLDDMKVLWND